VEHRADNLPEIGGFRSGTLDPEAAWHCSSSLTGQSVTAIDLPRCGGRAGVVA
jgi:hypothetical protein